MGCTKPSIYSWLGERRQLQSRVRMPRAFLEILPQIKVSVLFCIPPRRSFPHCNCLRTRCASGEDRSFRAGHGVKRTRSQTPGLKDLPKDLSVSKSVFIDAACQNFRIVLPFPFKAFLTSSQPGNSWVILQ